MNQDNMLKVGLIVSIVMFLLFGGLGFYFMSQLGSTEKPDSLVDVLTRLEERKKDFKEQIADLEVKIEEKDEGIVRTEWAAEIVEAHLKQLRRAWELYKMLKRARDSHHESLKRADGSISDLREGGSVEDAGGAPSLRSLRGEKDKLEEGYQQRRNDLQTGSDEISKDLTKVKLRHTRDYDEKRDDRSRRETEYVQIREELQKFMIREPPAVDVGYDGRALTVDIESRQVVVNIGERHGVRRGMRFEVFQLRHGDRRVHKGFLVVRSLGRETASCIIMDKAIALPRCPADGYTARHPEEQFCPYDSGGEAGGLHVQELSSPPKMGNMGMNLNDPIVVDDLVQNPLFAPGRKLHFAVKGDSDNPVHKSYKMEDFVAAVRWHGGVVDPELSAETDVLVAGKYAMEDVRKAREFGIRVLYQYELVDFLRK